ncbi:hypothetical protein [Sphingomonas sp. dw_22]|uniref:hypothetical protein n=1 Tax=Sphingomonas sp. dw_22 TaxID=2721175 RepID=UPI001BD32F90|nr:hypothetical protein [Sphingomonas sp. dw_22]
MLLKAGMGLAALIAAAVPVAASGADDIIGQLFDKASEIYSNKGYTATGWERRGSLEQGKEQVFQLALNGASEYQIIGVCDGDCENLDIHLYDASGKLVDKDDQTDDFPIVGVDASGNYVARVTMEKCGGTCAFGVKTFQK